MMETRKESVMDKFEKRMSRKMYRLFRKAYNRSFTEAQRSEDDLRGFFCDYLRIGHLPNFVSSYKS